MKRLNNTNGNHVCCNVSIREIIQEMNRECIYCAYHLTDLLTFMAEEGERMRSIFRRGVGPTGVGSVGVAVNTIWDEPSANLILGVPNANSCPEAEIHTHRLSQGLGS